MINDINLSLALDARKFNRGMQESRLTLGNLDKFQFKGVQLGIARSTKGLRDMENQAKRTTRALNGGIIGALDKTASKLRKTALVFAAGGIGLAGIGHLTKAGAWLSGIGAQSPKGKPPPIPGSSAAKRLALSQKLHGFGNKIVSAGAASRRIGYAATAGSLAVGAVPALAKLFSGSNKASKAVEGLAGNLGKYSSAAGRANHSSGILSSGFSVLKGGALGVATALAGITAGFAAAATSGIKMNMDMEEARAQFEVFTKSASKAESIMAALKKRADITPFSTQDYVEGGAALMSAAKGSQAELMKLMKTAEMLTVLNTKEGLTGAAIALKNALAGDYTSLQDRFNIAPSDIAKFTGGNDKKQEAYLKKLEKLGVKNLHTFKKSGMAGQEMVRAVLKSMNITEDSMMKLGRTTRGLWSTFTSFIDNIREKLSGGVFDFIHEKLASTVDWINANSDMVLNMATGIGQRFGVMAGRAWDFVGKVIQVFQPAILRIADILTVLFNGEAASILGGLLNRLVDMLQWATNLFLSVDFSKMGASLWNIAKEIGSMIFDVLVTAGEAIGAKIVEKLPAYLGGGKTSAQKNLDEAWQMYETMPDKMRQHTLEQLKIERESSGTRFGYNAAQEKINALEAVMRGEKTTGVRSIGSVISEHVEKSRQLIPQGAAAPGSMFASALQQIQATAARQQQRQQQEAILQQQQATYAKQVAMKSLAPARTYSGALQQMSEAGYSPEQIAKAMTGSGPAPKQMAFGSNYGAQGPKRQIPQRQTPKPKNTLNIRFTSMDGTINPLSR